MGYQITIHTVKDGNNYPKYEDERNACVHLSPPLEVKGMSKDFKLARGKKHAGVTSGLPR